MMDTPYQALSQVEAIVGRAAKNVYCDLGDRGYGLESDANIKIVGRILKRATRAQRHWLKRRAAIEPTIGHLKSDHRLNRNHLKGIAGSQAKTLLAAAYNLAKLLAWFYCACVLWIKQIKQSRQSAALATASNLLFVQSS